MLLRFNSCFQRSPEQKPVRLSAINITDSAEKKYLLPWKSTSSHSRCSVKEGLHPEEKINPSHHMGNASIFPLTSYRMRKCNKAHRMDWTWEIDTHTFPEAWVVFPHKIPILWYTSSYGKCMGFPINFP